MVFGRIREVIVNKNAEFQEAGLDVNGSNFCHIYLYFELSFPRSCFVVSVLVSMSLISLLLIICVFIMMHVAGKKKPPPKYHVHANQPSASTG